MGEPLLLQLFVASSIPVVKILLICTVGAACARKGILTPEGRRVLGSLSFLVFNPALIFVKLASTLTPGRLLHWWPLVLNTGISTTVGLGLGYLGVRLVRPPQPLRPHTVVAIALGNLGNLPLVIVSSLASSSAELLHGIRPDRAEDLAVSYVVVGLLVPVIAHATIGFNMLKKADVTELPEAEGSTGCSTGADGPSTTPRLAALAVQNSSQDLKDVPAIGGVAGARSVEHQKSLVPEGCQRRADSKDSSSCCCAAWGMVASERDGGASGLNSGAAAAGAAPQRAASGSLAGEFVHAKQHQHRYQEQHQYVQWLRWSSSGAAEAGQSANSVPLYECAVDCLGQGDSDPLLSGAHLPQHEQQRLVLLQNEQSPLLDGSETSGQELELGVAMRPMSSLEGGKGQPPAAAAAAVDLPSLAGISQRVPGRLGSCTQAPRFTADSCRPMLSRLVQPASRRGRLLLGRRSRTDWRALGRQVLREVTSPPLLAILLSVPVGCIAPLKRAFFVGRGSSGGGGSEGSVGGAPLGLLIACLSMLGDCTIPSILLLLGATLANGPGAARVPLRVIGLVNVIRLALLPLLGLGLVMSAYAARIFEAPDPIYLLVLLIQNTAPTAIMVHTMASVHDNRAEEVSSILFWGYISGIAMIPLWLTLFLYVVKLQFRYEDGNTLEA